MTIDAEDIKAAVDCRHLANDLGVTITARRRKKWGARCPTPGHEDRNPSAQIFVDGWKCWSCGAGGDCIDLWMVVYGVDFPTAIADLARWAGIVEGTPPVRRPPRPELDEGPTDGPEDVEAARAVLEAIWEGLTLEDDGADYLNGRGIDPTVACREGTRSVRRGEWERILAEYDDDELADAGLRHRERGFLQPFFHHRCPFLVFPYHDETGRLTSLRFRRIVDNDSPKALGLLSGAVGNLHRPPLLFGAPGQVRAAGRRGVPLYALEGELDALSLVTVGRFAVGAPGAHSFPARWSRGWGSVPEVIVLVDGDEAGRSTFSGSVTGAAVKNLGLEWVKNRLHLETFGDGLDANDLLQTNDLSNALQALEVRYGLSHPTPFPPPNPEGDRADVDEGQDGGHNSPGPVDEMEPEPPPSGEVASADADPSGADGEAVERQTSTLCETSLESLRAALSELESLPDNDRGLIRAIAYEAHSGPGSEWSARKLIFRRLYWEVEEVRREHRRLHQDKSRADGSGARDAAPRKPWGSQGWLNPVAEARQGA